MDSNLKPINLYMLWPVGDMWCCFVFAETPNKAKAWMTGYFDDTPYTDWRYKTCPSPKKQPLLRWEVINESN